jgi:hypothetical protein
LKINKTLTKTKKKTKIKTKINESETLITMRTKVYFSRYESEMKGEK